MPQTIVEVKSPEYIIETQNGEILVIQLGSQGPPGADVNAQNIGGEVEVFKQKTGGVLELRTLKSLNPDLPINVNGDVIEFDLTAAGEANTASNAGLTGVGLPLSKVGVDLPSKSVAANSNKIAVTDDVPNKAVNIDVVPANILTSELNNDAAFVDAVAAALAAPVQSVAGKTGIVVLIAADILDFNTAASAAAPVQSVAGKIGIVTLAAVDITDFSSAADARIALQKGVANGLATLGADSKIPSSQLPAIAITDTFVVASEVAQLALVAQQGDVAVRTDLSENFIQNGGTAGTMADWTMLLTPTDAVLSVNGQTGIVVLTTTNIAEGANLYFTQTRVSANTDVAANTAARHAAVTLAGAYDYLTISGQQITLAQIDLTTDVTGQLPASQSSYDSSMTPLGATDVQAAITETLFRILNYPFQAPVINRVAVLPGSPNPGDRYILTTNNSINEWTGAFWVPTFPVGGWVVVSTQDTIDGFGVILQYNGFSWVRDYAKLSALSNTFAGDIGFSGLLSPGFTFKNLTTLQRDALILLGGGHTIYNTDTETIDYRKTFSWDQLVSQEKLNNTKTTELLDGPAAGAGRSTGIFDGGQVQIATPTTFTQQSGSGQVVKHGTFPAAITPVPWAQFAAQTVDNIATESQTYLYIDQNGVLQQKPGGQDLTEMEYANNISTQILVHPDNATISSIVPNYRPVYDEDRRAMQLQAEVGIQNLGGFFISDDAVSPDPLALNIGNGKAYKVGVNHIADRTSADIVSFGALNRPEINEVYKLNSGAYFVNIVPSFNIDPTQYNDVTDPGNERKTIPGSNARATNARVYISILPGGDERVFYYLGQEWYATQVDALVAIPLEPIDEQPAALEATVFAGFLTIEKAGDVTTGVFTPAGRFRNQQVVSGGGSVPGAIQDSDFPTIGLMVASSGLGTYASRTLTGTANQVDVANGTGAIGNPTLSIPDILQLPDVPTTGRATFFRGANIPTSYPNDGPSLTGTIDISAGGPAITGLGTTFLADYAVGDFIRVQTGVNRGEVMEIGLIGDDFSMTANANSTQTANGVGHNQTGKSDALITPDASQSNTFHTILNQNSTLAAPINLTPIRDNQMFIFRIQQDPTGSRTLAYNAIYSFDPLGGAPTLATAAGAIDKLIGQYRGVSNKIVIGAIVREKV